MKVFIDVDELYPFYQIIRMSEGKNEIGARGVELPLDKVKHIEKVMDDFWEVQKFLRDCDELEVTL